VITLDAGKSSLAGAARKAPKYAGTWSAGTLSAGRPRWSPMPGSLADVDRAYGALAAYVASHALRVDGPIREYYQVGRQDTADENAWRTEVCWPIFSTGAVA
jgi:hypothetical protein